MDKNKTDDPNLMDHNYDGIEELDNPMPTWWLITFWGTIIFGAIYFYHYQFGSGPSSEVELEQELAEVQAKRDAVIANAPKQEVKDLSALIGDAEAIKSGEQVYQARCAACHGPKGEGSIGPNLTDNSWIHGEGDIESIAKIIAIGVPDKGMVAWKDIITPAELNNTAAFILSLKGSNPPNAKAAEGAEY